METPGEARFFLTFDATGFRYVFFLRHNYDMLEKFKELDNMISNKFDHTFEVLRPDNGREFSNKGMNKYLASRGI